MALPILISGLKWAIQKNRQEEEYKKVNEDILQKQEQLQSLLDKIQSPELKKLLEQLQQLMQASAGNKLYDLFLRRIPVLREKHLGPDWDGAFTFESK